MADDEIKMKDGERVLGFPGNWVRVIITAYIVSEYGIFF